MVLIFGALVYEVTKEGLLPRSVHNGLIFLITYCIPLTRQHPRNKQSIPPPQDIATLTNQKKVKIICEIVVLPIASFKQFDIIATTSTNGEKKIQTTPAQQAVLTTPSAMAIIIAEAKKAVAAKFNTTVDVVDVAILAKNDNVMSMMREFAKAGVNAAAELVA